MFRVTNDRILHKQSVHSFPGILNFLNTDDSKSCSDWQQALLKLFFEYMLKSHLIENNVFDSKKLSWIWPCLLSFFFLGTHLFTDLKLLLFTTSIFYKSIL